MCYPPETKAAVLAALLQGQSVTAVADRYKIPRGTVAAWTSRDKVHPQTSANRKREIGDLLLDLLQTQLESAKERARLFGDRVWLEKQGAAELATLHGVDIDKAVRLLEAFTGEDEEEAASMPVPAQTGGGTGSKPDS